MTASHIWTTVDNGLVIPLLLLAVAAAGLLAMRTRNAHRIAMWVLWLPLVKGLAAGAWWMNTQPDRLLRDPLTADGGAFDRLGFGTEIAMLVAALLALGAGIGALTERSPNTQLTPWRAGWALLLGTSAVGAARFAHPLVGLLVGVAAVANLLAGLRGVQGDPSGARSRTAWFAFQTVVLSSLAYLQSDLVNHWKVEVLCEVPYPLPWSAFTVLFAATGLAFTGATVRWRRWAGEQASMLAGALLVMGLAVWPLKPTVDTWIDQQQVDLPIVGCARDGPFNLNPTQPQRGRPRCRIDRPIDQWLLPDDPLPPLDTSKVVTVVRRRNGSLTYLELLSPTGLMVDVEGERAHVTVGNRQVAHVPLSELGATLDRLHRITLSTSFKIVYRPGDTPRSLLAPFDGHTSHTLGVCDFTPADPTAVRGPLNGVVELSPPQLNATLKTLLWTLGQQASCSPGVYDLDVEVSASGVAVRAAPSCVAQLLKTADWGDFRGRLTQPIVLERRIRPTGVTTELRPQR